MELSGLQKGRHMQEVPANQSAVNRTVLAAAFGHWFGLKRSEVSILVALYQSAGEFIGFKDLATSERISPDAMWVRVSRLRQALECEAVDSVPGRGYCLTEVGVAECQRALAAFAESLQPARGAA
jgi:hypothetical protein